MAHPARATRSPSRICHGTARVSFIPVPDPSQTLPVMSYKPNHSPASDPLDASLNHYCHHTKPHLQCCCYPNTCAPLHLEPSTPILPLSVSANHYNPHRTSSHLDRLSYSTPISPSLRLKASRKGNGIIPAHIFYWTVLATTRKITRIASHHTLYKPRVTSVVITSSVWLIVTLWRGFSRLEQSPSLGKQPIIKLPPGTTTVSKPSWFPELVLDHRSDNVESALEPLPPLEYPP